MRGLMATRQMLSQDFSNWECVAFCLIREILVGRNVYFSRSELMSYSNLDLAIKLLALLGHKAKPKHPEETLQRTIQNLRDKGFIDFLGQGEYKLTRSGCEAVESFDAQHELLNLLKKKG